MPEQGYLSMRRPRIFLVIYVDVDVATRHIAAVEPVCIFIAVDRLWSDMTSSSGHVAPVRLEQPHSPVPSRDGDDAAVAAQHNIGRALGNLVYDTVSVSVVCTIIVFPTSTNTPAPDGLVTTYLSFPRCGGSSVEQRALGIRLGHPHAALLLLRSDLLVHQHPRQRLELPVAPSLARALTVLSSERDQLLDAPPHLLVIACRGTIAAT